MNVSSTKISYSPMNQKRTDAPKSTFFASGRGAAAKASGAPLMRNSLSRRSTKKSQESSIDAALGIISSPDCISKARLSERRGSVTRGRRSFHRSCSSISERRASELLPDNSDRLSELMTTSYNNIDAFETDDESDLED